MNARMVVTVPNDDDDREYNDAGCGSGNGNDHDADETEISAQQQQHHQQSPSRPTFSDTTTEIDVMNNSKNAFKRAALFQACKQSAILSNIDFENASNDAILELVNQYNSHSIRELPIILSKASVKSILVFLINKFPTLGKYVNPENIRVKVEDDELAYLISTPVKRPTSLITIVIKNIAISTISSSIVQLRNDLLGDTDKASSKNSNRDVDKIRVFSPKATLKTKELPKQYTGFGSSEQSQVRSSSSIAVSPRRSSIASNRSSSSSVSAVCKKPVKRLSPNKELKEQRKQRSRSVSSTASSSSSSFSSAAAVSLVSTTSATKQSNRKNDTIDQTVAVKEANDNDANRKHHQQPEIMIEPMDVDEDNNNVNNEDDDNVYRDEGENTIESKPRIISNEAVNMEISKFSFKSKLQELEEAAKQPSAPAQVAPVSLNAFMDMIQSECGNAVATGGVRLADKLPENQQSIVNLTNNHKSLKRNHDNDDDDDGRSRQQRLRPLSATIDETTNMSSSNMLMNELQFDDDDDDDNDDDDDDNDDRNDNDDY